MTTGNVNTQDCSQQLV